MQYTGDVAVSGLIIIALVSEGKAVHWELVS